MKKFQLLFAAILASVILFSQGNEAHLLIGTYTSGSSEGIYVYKFNTATGESILESSIKSSNPSYLAVSPDKKFVFAVNEDAPGHISSYSFDKVTGKLALVSQQPSKGNHPCYVTVTNNGKWLLTGNYSSGNFSVNRINKNGTLDSARTSIQHEGYSVNADRQQAPHVHATVLSKDNKYLFVPDLGIDKLMIYSFNAKNGKVAPAKIPFQMVEAGAGPRHFDFTPSGKFAYLMEELTGSISAYSYYKGTLTLIQNISALPGDFNGAIGSADIHVSPDGKFLYASNRGESNTIAIFSVNETTGMLRPVGHQSVLGKTPRNFNFDPSGNFLLVANQNSDEIVVFVIDHSTGLLTDTGKRIKVSKPVCIKWISN